MEGIKRPREVLHKEQCISFVNKLWAADTLAMFHHPVSATEVPGYHEVVAEPMDLSTIRRKIEAGTYATDAEVEDDVALMLSNALDFNERGSQWHDLAKQLKKRYPDLAKKCGLSFDADQVFIPTKKVRDDESTLRKAERKGGEKLDDVLQAMEKEKEIPLEKLRAMYARRSADAADAQVSSDSDDSNAAASSDDDDDEGDSSDYGSEEDEDSEEDDEEEEDSSESASESQPAKKQ